MDHDIIPRAILVKLASCIMVITIDGPVWKLADNFGVLVVPRQSFDQRHNIDRMQYLTA
jgi:hypothetical protein